MPRCHADGSPVTRSAAVARPSVKRRPMPAGTIRTPSSDAPRGATRTAPSSTCTADTPSSRLTTKRVPSAAPSRSGFLRHAARSRAAACRTIHPSRSPRSTRRGYGQPTSARAASPPASDTEPPSHATPRLGMRTRSRPRRWPARSACPTRAGAPAIAVGPIRARLPWATRQSAASALRCVARPVRARDWLGATPAIAHDRPRWWRPTSAAGTSPPRHPARGDRCALLHPCSRRKLQAVAQCARDVQPH
ncbi:hypothetical protein G6F35_012998 [Rhizopus arrhizus]|nr:hypothetical protein G6F35_012998 [Rhizopus arrhizus]